MFYMLEFVNSVMAWFMKQRIQEVQHFMNNPHEVQQQVFIDIALKPQTQKLAGNGALKTLTPYGSSRRGYPFIATRIYGLT